MNGSTLPPQGGRRSPAAAWIDPTARAFLLQEQLNDLHEAHLDGDDVPALRFVELEDALDAALAAEAALAPPDVRF